MQYPNISNYNGLMQYVLGILGKTNDSTYNTNVGIWVNNAILAAIKFFPRFSFLTKSTSQTLTAGVRTYNLPSDYWTSPFIYCPYDLTNNVYFELENISPLEAIEGYTLDLKTLPESYVLNFSSYDLYPMPDQAYQIQIIYQAQPAQLLNLTDTNEFIISYPMILAYFALSEGFAVLQEDYWSKYYAQKFQLELQLAKSEDIKSKLQRFKTLHIRTEGIKNVPRKWLEDPYNQ